MSAKITQLTTRVIMCCLFFLATFYATAQATFEFTPANPTSSQAVTVKITDHTPYAYVGLTASKTGGNTYNGTWGGVVSPAANTWTWTYTLPAMPDGLYEIKFTYNNGANVAGTTGLRVGAPGIFGGYNPNPPVAGQNLRVQFTDNTPSVYVGLRAVGPNTINGTYVSVSNNGNGTWTWNYDVSGLQAGTYTLIFTANNGALEAGRTSIVVQDSGTSPGEDTNTWFTIDPPYPSPSAPVTIQVKSYTGYTGVSLQVISGTFNQTYTDLAVSESGDLQDTHIFVWTKNVGALAAGTYTIIFRSNGTEMDRINLVVQNWAMRSFTKNIYGFNGHYWFTYNYPCLSFDRIQRFIDEYKALGAKAIRFGIDWQTVEAARGSYDFHLFDDIVNRFAANGIEVVGLVTTAPGWAVTNNEPNKTYGPDLTNYARTCASRYAGKISRWEFWNEPYYKSEFAKGENFAFWLKSFMTGIKQGNASAVVAMGSVEQNDNGSKPLMFIHDVLTAMEGSRPDGIVLHPYASSGIGTAQIESVASLAPSIPLWITEYGWNGMDNATMATNITNALNYLQSKSFIEFASMHMLHDWNQDGGSNDASSCTFSDDTQVGERYGLVTKEFYEGGQFTRKAEPWEAFRAQAGGPGIPPACQTPTNLSNNNITSTSATVSWTAVSGASNYQVAYKPSASTSGWLYATTTTTSANLTGLTPSTQYVWIVGTACVGGATSSYSNNTYFTTLASCDAPSTTSTTNIASGSATLNWSAVTGASSYQVAYKPSASTGAWTYLTSTSTSITLTGLTASTQYVWIVGTACSNGSVSAYTANTYFTTQASCAAPASTSTTNITASSATVSWAAVTGASSYQVAYKPSASTGGWQYITTSSTSAMLTGLTGSTQYVWIVGTACTNGTTSAYTNNVYFTTLAPCNAPSSTSSSNVTSTSAVVSWAGVTGASTYQVAYKPSASTGGWLYVTTSSTSTTLAGLTSSTQYVWIVGTACTNGTTSSYTSNSYFTTSSPCVAPPGTSTSNVTSTTAIVSWTAVSGAGSYQVAYKPSASTGSWQYVTTSATSITLTSLTSSTQYVWIVGTACTNGTTSGYSSNTYFTTLAPCTAPVNRYVSSITSTSAYVYWASVPGATQYNIAYKPGGATTGWLYKAVTGTGTTLTGLLRSTQYVWVVESLCPNGWTAYSANNYFTTAATGRMSQEDVDANITSEENDLSVYPNPSEAQADLYVKFHLTRSSHVTISLMDVNGKIVQEKNLGIVSEGEHETSLSNHKASSGIYLIRLLTSEGGVRQKRIVIK